MLIHHVGNLLWFATILFHLVHVISYHGSWVEKIEPLKLNYVKTAKTKASCHIMSVTIKAPPCSKALNASIGLNIASLHQQWWRNRLNAIFSSGTYNKIINQSIIHATHDDVSDNAIIIPLAHNTCTKNKICCRLLCDDWTIHDTKILGSIHEIILLANERFFFIILKYELSSFSLKKNYPAEMEIITD